MNMNFGKLLAVGKSWMGGDGSGRYRMEKNFRLPQFISPRNPFRKEIPAETLSHSSPTPSATAEQPGQSQATAAFSPWPRAGNGLRRFAAFCMDHNPFSRISRPKLPVMPRFGRRAEQGELTLDKVKVLRGDLNHSDLEVVQAGAGAHHTGNAAWKSMTARIFSAGRR
jgi:hypothetical protein